MSKKPMTFEEFVFIIETGIAEGKIKIDVELNELDYALQFAIGRALEDDPQKRNFTYEELAELVRKYCGEEVYNRALLKR